MHSVLDVPVGIVTFIPAVVLLSTSVGLLITFPIAIPFIILLFLFARLVGRVERHRLAALHGTQLADPIPPTTPGPLWRRFIERITSAPRWKEIGYCIVRLPTGLAFGLGATTLWAGSLALVALPATIHLMPNDRAQFWLFTVGDLPTVLLVALVGVVGLDLDRADFYEKELSFQVSCSYGPGRYDAAYEEQGQDYPLGFVRWTE